MHECKYTAQLFLVNVYSCAAITTTHFKTPPSSSKIPVCLFAVNLLLPYQPDLHSVPIALSF